MKTKKIFTVVLTLVVSLGMSSNYFITRKAMNNISNSSTAMVIEDKINKGTINEVSSTKLAKDNQKVRNVSTVTSRSGMRKPLVTVQNADEIKNTTAESQDNNENATQTPGKEPEPEVISAKPTYQGIELEYSAVYNISASRLTKSKGVVYYNGHKETYYSQRVLSGKGLKMLNNNGRHVADDGTIRDGDGYIAVACNYLPKGSQIMTSLGPGKVYDTGGMTGKWIDIYVNW